MKLFYLTLLTLILSYACEKLPDSFLTVVELDKNEIIIRVNEESTLSIDSYYPEKPDSLQIEWFSTDTNRVIVDNGIVIGVAPGQAMVYVKVNGIQSQSCNITIIGVYDADNDVYILGNQGKKLMYWKNGIPTQVTEAKFRIIGKAIHALDENIYVAGDDYTSEGYPVAKCWINGKEIVLSEKHSQVRDIAVSQNDVYVVGCEVKENGVTTATLWKNGIVNYLDENALFSIANAITITNGDIYVVGYSNVYENKTNYEVAKYWKNGEEIEITRSNTAYAHDIYIKDNKVYALVNGSLNNKYLAKYWVDDKEFILSERSSPTFARSMTISGNDLYVSGVVYDESINHSYATLWVNGVEKWISTNSLYGEICEIASSNGDVYVLANENHPNFYGPKYWKNGKEIFFEHYHNISFASDIFIVQK